MNTPALNVTLAGRFGIELNIKTPIACTRKLYSKGELLGYGLTNRPGSIVASFGVGTTGDPSLSEAERATRSAIEEANNPFRR
jgi:hypothetical protein